MIGLVTVLFNSDQVLNGFFKSLSLQDYKNYHLYLVDNSPSALTKKLIQELTDQYSILNYTHIEVSSNCGVAKGNNIGIELSLSEGHSSILLLNNDIEFHQKNILSELVKMSSKSGYEIIVPKILFFDTRRIWMAGGVFFWYKAATKHIGENQSNSSRFDHERKCNYAPTCFMIIHRSVFEKVGLMDENYFVYYDDTDFIYRAIDAGFHVNYLPQFEVLHKVSSSTGGGDSPFTIYYLTRNRFYFARKHLNIFKRYTAFIYSFLAIFYHAFSYDRKQRLSISRGIRDGFSLRIS